MSDCPKTTAGVRNFRGEWVSRFRAKSRRVAPLRRRVGDGVVVFRVPRMFLPGMWRKNW